MKNLLALHGRPILFISVLLLAGWFPVSSFLYSVNYDMLNQFFPCRYFLSECFRHGTLPLWCPYINMGYPAYADPQGGFFYPVTWFITALGGYNVYSIAVEFLLHVIAGGIGFYFLLHYLGNSKNTAVVFGIVYGLSGLFVGNAQHLSWVIAMAWLPAVLLCFIKTIETPSVLSATFLGLFLYLFVCGGYPAFVIILFYLLLVYWVVTYVPKLIQGLYKKTFSDTLFLLLAVGIAAVLSAGYLYSVLQTLPDIDRGEALSAAKANTFPFSLPAMISFVFPFVTVCKSYEMFTDVSMANIYGGVLLLPLAVVGLLKIRHGRFVWCVFAFGVVCFLAAAGDLLPVRTWLFYLLPGMKMFRHAAIFRVFTLLGLLLVAAPAFDWLLKNLINDKTVVLKFLSVVFLLLLLVFLVALFFNSFFLSFPEIYNAAKVTLYNTKRNALAHLTAQCLAQLIALALMLFAVWYKPMQRLAVGAICLLVILEIAVAAFMNIPTSAVSAYSAATVQRKLNLQPKGFPAPALVPLENFRHTDDGSLAPAYFNLSIFKKQPAVDGFNNFKLKEFAQLEGTPQFNEIIKHPLVYFADTNNSCYTAAIRIEKFSPNEMVFSLNAPKDGKLVLLQNFSSNWKAKAEGEEVRIEKLEQAFMQVALKQGLHRVCFEFKPMVVVILFWFTAMAVLLICIWLVIQTRNSPNT